MADKTGFTIEVTSPYAEFWRYNIALMCGCFDAQDTRTDFASAEDTVAETGANLKAAPEGYPAERIARLETPPADHILLYIYIIPHTLPAGNNIADTHTFPLNVHITHRGKKISATTYQINQWSGISIELRVPQKNSTQSIDL